MQTAPSRGIATRAEISDVDANEDMPISNSVVALAAGERCSQRRAEAEQNITERTTNTQQFANILFPVLRSNSPQASLLCRSYGERTASAYSRRSDEKPRGSQLSRPKATYVACAVTLDADGEVLDERGSDKTSHRGDRIEYAAKNSTGTRVLKNMRCSVGHSLTLGELHKDS